MFYLCLFLLSFCQVLIAGLKETHPSYSESINPSLGALRTAQKSILQKKQSFILPQPRGLSCAGLVQGRPNTDPSFSPHSKRTVLHSTLHPTKHNTRESLSTHPTRSSSSHTTQPNHVFQEEIKCTDSALSTKTNNRCLNVAFI